MDIYRKGHFYKKSYWMQKLKPTILFDCLRYSVNTCDEVLRGAVAAEIGGQARFFYWIALGRCKQTVDGCCIVANTKTLINQIKGG